MAKSFLETIKIKDPKFLKEYEGKYIQSPEGIYQVKGGQVSLIFTQQQMTDLNLQPWTFNVAKDAEKRRLADISKGAAQFTEVGGLQPFGKAEYATAEAFRYAITPPTPTLDIGFRARRQGEDMTSYLKEKQTAELAQTGQTNISENLTENLAKAQAAGQRDRFDAQGNFITDTGQKISPQDPSFAQFIKQAGVIAPSDESAEQIAKFNEGDSQVATADKSPLKNENIAKANPGVIANKNFINALYQEQFNRDATQAELDKFSGRTVKDAANIILGADKSPFSVKRETTTQPTDGQNVIRLPNGQIISPDDPNFEEFSQIEGATEISADISELENNPFYQNLSDDLKFIAETMLELVNESDPQRKAQLEEAIELARAEVDPFNKVMVDFALQSIPDQFRLSKLTTQEQLRRNRETLKEIGNMVEDATFEEQQALGSIARTFERNIENLEEQIAEGGLTFGSRRAETERFIGEQNVDLIQSTQRGTRTQLRKLEQQRKDTQEQEKLTREAGEATLRQIARGAEEQLGTERFKGLGLKDLGGQAIKPVGTVGEKGFIGSLEAQRAEQIRSLAQTFQQFANPSAIENLF